MKFQNLTKLSYRSNQLEKAHLEKIKTGSRFKIRIIAELFFLFFYLFFFKLIWIWKFQKPESRFWTAIPNLLLSRINRFELSHQIAAGGGGLAPAPRFHNF